MPAAYRSGSTTFIDFLLGASSLPSSLQNWELLNQINANDADLVDQTKSAREQLQAAKDEFARQEQIAAQKAAECKQIHDEVQVKVQNATDLMNSSTKRRVPCLSRSRLRPLPQRLPRHRQRRRLQLQLPAATMAATRAAAAMMAATRAAAAMMAATRAAAATAAEAPSSHPGGGGSAETICRVFLRLLAYRLPVRLGAPRDPIRSTAPAWSRGHIVSLALNCRIKARLRWPCYSSGIRQRGASG